MLKHKILILLPFLLMSNIALAETRLVLKPNTDITFSTESIGESFVINKAKRLHFIKRKAKVDGISVISTFTAESSQHGESLVELFFPWRRKRFGTGLKSIRKSFERRRKDNKSAYRLITDTGSIKVNFLNPETFEKQSSTNYRIKLKKFKRRGKGKKHIFYRGAMLSQWNLALGRFKFRTSKKDLK